MLLPKFLPIVFFQEWKTTKLELAKEHVYNHFNVFLYQCEECRDLFRRQVQLERHAALHAKRREKLDMRTGDGEREDKVGDYHLAAEASYLPWREAKPVLDTYLVRSEDGQVPYLSRYYLLKKYFRLFDNVRKGHLSSPRLFRIDVTCYQ